MTSYFLIAHSQTPELRVQQLQAQVTFLENGDAQFAYYLQAQLDELTMPAKIQASEQDGLWQHTCLEAFVQVSGETSYHEFNFSPSTAWAAYAFKTYRERDLTWYAPQAPKIQTDYLSENSFVLMATLPASLLPANVDKRAWQIGLTAVIEHKQGYKSYWALTHAAETPDFHQAASFTLTI